MAQTINLDLVAPKVVVKLNSRGAHMPLLWRLQGDPLGNITAVDLTGASARLEAFSDCEMATTALWTKSTANGQLILASTPSKTFIVDGAELVLSNVFSIAIKISDTESDQVWDLGEEGLHALLYVTPAIGDEYVMARLMLTAVGIC